MDKRGRKIKADHTRITVHRADIRDLIQKLYICQNGLGLFQDALNDESNQNISELERLVPVLNLNKGLFIPGSFKDYKRK